MSILHISLPESLRRFVESQLGNGAFQDASDYVRSLIEADQERNALGPEELEELRRQVAVGVEQLERGESTTYDDTTINLLLEEIETRGKARLAARQRGADS